MSLNGMWTVEIYGIYGWESTGVLSLEDGRAIGGGNNHYSMGIYTVLKDGVEMDLDIDYFGSPRTMFGEARREITLRFEGEQEGDVIDGTLRRSDKPKMVLTARLTRKTALPTRRRRAA